jgi:hypothetical protein
LSHDGDDEAFRLSAAIARCWIAAAGARRLPIGARPVIDGGELPSPLQKLVIKLHHSDQVWSAWIDEEDIWFFTAEMSLSLSREHGRPTLEVGSYNVDGTMKEWQPWVYLNEGTWQQCAL